MDRRKIMLGGLAIAFGVLVSLIVISIFWNSAAKGPQKQQAIAAWIVLGLPALGSGSLLWRSWRADQMQAERDRLRTVFFEVMCQNAGYVTPLKLAVATGLDRAEAKAYLQARAKELKAKLQVNKDGQVGYQFDLT